MFRLYALFSTCLGLVLLPLLLALGMRKKYRQRLPGRLGFGLRSCLHQRKTSARQAPPELCIWIHALSVGEVTSALPLVRGLRKAFPQAELVFSANSNSGHQVAERLIAPWVDALIPAPLDFVPTVYHLINTIRPNLFILVETDFWPNWLSALARHNIPLVLVNGRISGPSFQRYQSAAFFFRPLFALFDLLSMQTAADADNMKALGVPERKVYTLGNLKFDTSQYRTKESTPSRSAMRLALGFSDASPLWICGSTHPGEERIVLEVLQGLRMDFPDLQLLLAPRKIERAGEVTTLVASMGLTCRKRSVKENGIQAAGILILDTLGELAHLYPMADCAFIGGSLVDARGHNPLEAAAYAVPVFFGPHMEDFAEIAQGLCQSGGAQQIDSAEMLYLALHRLLADPDQGKEMACAAQNFVLQHQGVVQAHIKALENLLNQNKNKQRNQSQSKERDTAGDRPKQS